MIITLIPELEAALNEAARRQGISPELLVFHTLMERYLGTPRLQEPRDEWERGLRKVAVDCGVSLSDEAVSSEGIYE